MKIGKKIPIISFLILLLMIISVFVAHMVIKKSAENLNIEAKVSSFHAGAETHVLSNEKTNSKKEKFLPLLLGIANIYNMHSSEESLDWQSLVLGRDWLRDIVLEFAKKQ